MLITLSKTFSRQHFEIFSCFSQETGFDISCKLFPLHEMSKPILWEKIRKKKKIINLSSAEFSLRLVKVNIWGKDKDFNVLSLYSSTLSLAVIV